MYFTVALHRHYPMKETGFDDRIQRYQYDATEQLLAKIGESLSNPPLPPSHFL
jgi:hypothetical protein